MRSKAEVGFADMSLHITTAITVCATARQQDFAIKAGTVTFEHCEKHSTQLDDAADDNFIEASCSVTSYPKSKLTWTTDPINKRGYPIKETNKVRPTLFLASNPLSSPARIFVRFYDQPTIQYPTSLFR